jgi:hypothetical protein
MDTFVFQSALQNPSTVYNWYYFWSGVLFCAGCLGALIAGLKNPKSPNPLSLSMMALTIFWWVGKAMWFLPVATGGFTQFLFDAGEVTEMMCKPILLWLIVYMFWQFQYPVEAPSKPLMLFSALVILANLGYFGFKTCQVIWNNPIYMPDPAAWYLQVYRVEMCEHVLFFALSALGLIYLRSQHAAGKMTHVSHVALDEKKFTTLFVMKLVLFVLFYLQKTVFVYWPIYICQLVHIVWFCMMIRIAATRNCRHHLEQVVV